MMIATVNWTDVLVALIAGLPAIIAAVGVILLHRQVATPSGKSIGKQVEDALHVSLANNLHLQAVSGKVEASVSPEAAIEEAKVSTLTGEAGATEPEPPPPVPPQ